MEEKDLTPEEAVALVREHGAPLVVYYGQGLLAEFTEAQYIVVAHWRDGDWFRLDSLGRVWAFRPLSVEEWKREEPE